MTTDDVALLTWTIFLVVSYYCVWKKFHQFCVRCVVLENGVDFIVLSPLVSLHHIQINQLPLFVNSDYSKIPTRLAPFVLESVDFPDKKISCVEKLACFDKHILFQSKE